MKISVITSAFNSVETIRDTLDSVRQQDYPNIEYIIVDGASEDGTMDVVAEYHDIVSISISEPDGGIYEALNKGIALATGDVVGFLHSDDLFADPSVLSKIAQAFESSGTDAVYGDLDYVQRADPKQVHRKWRSKPFDPALFYKGWMPAHPTFYLKRFHYENHGGYDTSFRQSADYELMLRMLLKQKLNAVYIPELLVKMRVGGASNVTLSNRWKANQEDARAWKKNGLKPGLFTRVLKPISKLRQFFT
ncbi:MAG: glycosyltransferase [Flavobacteriales bacterium]|nr:glycosyltransferase [Flavobacteriales bacterium]